MAAQRLHAASAQLVVVDAQAKLLPHIDGHAPLVEQIVRMIAAARVLQTPIVLTEQYPQGLGPTHESIRSARCRAPLLQKMSFSVLGEPALRERLLASRRPQFLIVGIEAHVCVQQTVLDLLADGQSAFVLADGVSSRRALDRETALRRMAAAGAVVTTVESAIFELTGRADSPHFKQILALVR